MFDRVNIVGHDTVNTISVNHIQLKLISEMFEIFALLINLLILIIPDKMVF